jgi:hypothetical protein
MKTLGRECMKAGKVSLGFGHARLAILLAFVTALSACEEWFDEVILTSVGLSGKTVLSLVIDPNQPSILYAGMDGLGIYKTSDGGTNWTQLSSGITDKRVLALIVDPNITTTLYAGTPSKGVFRSYDGGATWSPANTGLTSLGVHTLAIDPSATTTIYCGTGDGVFKTIDGGDTWSGAYSTGLPAERSIDALAINPATASELYAGLDTTGVYKSTDGAVSWTASNSGLVILTIRSLCIDPDTTSTVYAGTEWIGEPWGQVSKSIDSGASWTGNWPCGTGVLALAVDPHDSKKVFAGTWPAGAAVSDDGGATWAISHDANPPDVHAFAVDAVSSIVYAGTSDGVMKVTVEKRRY